MKSLIISATLLFSSLAYAGDNKSLEVDVSLFPAGSFTVKTDKIKGKLSILKDGTVKADGIKILVKYLDTGLELRNEHTHKRLGIEKDEKAALVLKDIKAKDGKGVATFVVNNVEQSTEIVYKTLDNNIAEANFKLDLEKFDIKGISYLGVGVEKEVQVKVKLPYATE